MREAEARYEAENQAMLAHCDAVEVTVVRDEEGYVISAVGMFSKGVEDILFHASPSRVRPKAVHVSTTRRAG